MRKVNVTLLALVAVCLVVAPLAFGQGGNPAIKAGLPRTTARLPAVLCMTIY